MCVYIYIYICTYLYVCLYSYIYNQVAILDEATSALDEVSEAAMYTLLDKLNLTYMSVGMSIH
jgi:ABC-type Mn2+/Zn2+ transport system ATPase subunit